jgi:hypothetical protein
MTMKTIRLLVIVSALGLMAGSCKTMNSVFGPKYGCPTNGKNVGAEKLLSGDPDATKAAKKARKFKD